MHSTLADFISKKLTIPCFAEAFAYLYGFPLKGNSSIVEFECFLEQKSILLERKASDFTRNLPAYGDVNVCYGNKYWNLHCLRFINFRIFVCFFYNFHQMKYRRKILNLFISFAIFI